MSTANSHLIRPLITSHFQFRKPHKFSPSKIEFSQKLVSVKSKFLDISSSPARTGSVRIRAGGEGFRHGGLEQEALINGSINFASDGLQATLNKLSKWMVAALFGIIFLWRHDVVALWAASGSVLNAGLSTILKRILNQERPVSTLRSDPGMPSSHAQSIFYTVTFCIISMVEYFGLNGITAAIGGLILVIGSYFSWLRVSEQLHTISQVAVGAALGFFFSISWCRLWDAIVLKAFISHLWVRIIVVLGAAGFCLGFLLYVIRYWVLDEH